MPKNAFKRCIRRLASRSGLLGCWRDVFVPRSFASLVWPGLSKARSHPPCSSLGLANLSILPALSLETSGLEVLLGGRRKTIKPCLWKRCSWPFRKPPNAKSIIWRFQILKLHGSAILCLGTSDLLEEVLRDSRMHDRKASNPRL